MAPKKAVGGSSTRSTRSNVSNKRKRVRGPLDGGGGSSTPSKKARTTQLEERDGDEEDAIERQDHSDSEEPKVDKRDSMVIGIKRGVAPVDPKSDLVDTHLVYATKAGVWDAVLCQNDVVGYEKKNLFYALQIVHPADVRGDCYLYTRWGRIGTTGQRKLDGPWPATTAIQEFKKLFRTRTGIDWGKRMGMVPAKGKYTWVERDYLDGEATGTKKDVIAVSELEPEVQNLFRTIFSPGIIKARLTSVHYDSEKLPFGKLGRSTVIAASATLQILSEIIKQPKGEKARQQGGFQTACQKLSSIYYSLIPRVMEASKLLVIDDEELLKKELDFVDALLDKERPLTLAFTKEAMNERGDQLNPLDANVRSLGSISVQVVMKDTKEFKTLETCVRETHCTNPEQTQISLVNCYRIERASECAAWYNKGFDKLKRGQRLLLWYGARIGSVADILRHGLRIPRLMTIPDGVKFGHVLGDAIYFYDMTVRAMKNCDPETNNGVVVFFLCEVAAKPFMTQDSGLKLPRRHVLPKRKHKNKEKGELSKKGHGKTQPTKWKDAGEALDNDELVGCDMTVGPGKEMDRDSHRYLQHNQYAVYDASQIRIRYLLIAKV